MALYYFCVILADGSGSDSELSDGVFDGEAEAEAGGGGGGGKQRSANKKFGLLDDTQFSNAAELAAVLIKLQFDAGHSLRKGKTQTSTKKLTRSYSCPFMTCPFEIRCVDFGFDNPPRGHFEGLV